MSAQLLTRIRRGAIWTLILMAIGLPILLSMSYGRFTKIPASISIAAGPEGGQYRDVAEALSRELMHRRQIKAEIITTGGAGANAIKVANGQADIGLYQRGSVGLELAQHGIVIRDLESVGALYSEVVHWMKRPDHADVAFSDMDGFRISIGPEHSGSEMVGRYLIEEFDLADKVELVHLSLTETKAAFQNQEIDAAIITIGIQAPVLEQLLNPDEEGHAPCVLSTIPFADAIAARSVFLEPYTVPRGMYGQKMPGIPALPVTTLASRAQLITSNSASSELTELIAEILNDPVFQRATGMNELLTTGEQFATEHLDFPLHAGAAHFYEPGLKPLLNVEFVEATEGIRSFVVSLLIALFFGVKWLRGIQARSSEHRLDRFIRRLLDIEREQKFLDQTDQTDDRKKLQDLLDQVTDLRQQALKEFSAHEINSDRAAECFIAMCSALSEKINAKISRQRLDARFKELEKVLSSSD